MAVCTWILLLLLHLMRPRSAVCCRWALVAGSRETNASELFTSPAHGLVHQSFSAPVTPLASGALLWDPSTAGARNNELNLDGWGIGWWSPDGPHRHRSGSGVSDPVTRAADPELLAALPAARSRILLGHIRAATGQLELCCSRPCAT